MTEPINWREVYHLSESLGDQTPVVEQTYETLQQAYPEIFALAYAKKFRLPMESALENYAEQNGLDLGTTEGRAQAEAEMAETFSLRDGHYFPPTLVIDGGNNARASLFGVSIITLDFAELGNAGFGSHNGTYVSPSMQNVTIHETLHDIDILQGTSSEQFLAYMQACTLLMNEPDPVARQQLAQQQAEQLAVVWGNPNFSSELLQQSLLFDYESRWQALWMAMGIPAAEIADIDPASVVFGDVNITFRTRSTGEERSIAPARLPVDVAPDGFQRAFTEQWATIKTEEIRQALYGPVTYLDTRLDYYDVCLIESPTTTAPIQDDQQRMETFNASLAQAAEAGLQLIAGGGQQGFYDAAEIALGNLVVAAGQALPVYRGTDCAEIPRQ